MRDSRKLAFILAALAATSLPVVALAQNAPAGNNGAQGNASNDDDDDEEEETAPANGNATTPAPSGPASNDPVETDDARRTRVLPRYSTLDGSIGLLRTSSGQLGGAGSFRFGIIGEYFGTSEFLRPPSLSGTAAVGGTDSADHVGGTVTLSYSPLDFLEVYGSIRAYANSNNRERPTLFQVLGDSNLGVKAAFRVARGIYVGGNAGLWLLNRSGDIGLLGDSTSFDLRVLGTFDVHEMTRQSVPLRFHVNAQYYFDNSSSIVSDTEARRRAAQPGFDSSICSTGAAASEPRCFLEVSRVERFALGINRLDRLNINIGVEAPLPYVHPFVEWQVGVPVNRQGYQCYDPPSGGARPGGAGDDDLCFANQGFSSIPSRLTIGARVLPPVRGLSALLAVDVGTSGTSTFVRELAPTPPWQLYFGAAFAYDTHPVVQRVEVAGEPRIETREVDRTPPGGHVLGQVRDAEGHAGIQGAVVTFDGHPELPILASAPDGRFRSGRIAPGDYRLRVTAPDYNPGECAVTITGPAAPAAAPSDGASSTAPATAPAPSGPAPETEATVNCDLRAMPRRGGLTVRVVSSVGGAGVAGVPVLITPADSAAGQPRTETTGADGTVTVGELLAGAYTVQAQSSDRHMGGLAQPTNVVARQSTSVDLTVTRRPARPSVAIRGNLLTIARQVHFQTNSAEILPDSNTLLEEIADVIGKHPELVSIDIQGHTDNQGQPASNQTLSEARANSVREALIRLGIEGNRLVAHGFGQTRPVRPNLTAAGRAANRRVEFHITRAPGAAATPAARPAAARPAARPANP